MARARARSGRMPCGDRGDICRLVSVGDVVGHDSMCAWSPDDLVKPFAALLAESTERSVSLRGVIDLWPLDVTTGLMTASELQDSQKIVTGAALALFRAMAEARVHPGVAPRIWLVSRNAIPALPADPPVEVAAGGLWGLGRSAALEHPRNWGGLVDLESAGQSSPSNDAAALLREGLKGDVTSEQDVRGLLGWIEQSGRPLKGVCHCAGLLDDGIIAQMDWQKFDRVTAPKVAGGWLLHEYTRGLDLTHFVMFSSILSLIGSAGQANYAAANAFLDALVAHRRGEGLPGLALNWGPWDETGLATVSGGKGRAS